MSREFRHRLRVRWPEADIQGVVYFARYADYVDLAITELWRERIRPYGEMMAAGDDFMVAEMRLRYRGSARFDEEIDVVLDVEQLGNTSMTTAWRIERDGEVLCDGTIRHVCVDAVSHAKKRIPDEVRAALA